MSNHRAAILIVPAAIALAGLFHPETIHAQPLVVASDEAIEPVLRVQLDLARGRRWELRWDGVRAYDLASGELVRRIPLPGATLAGSRDSCLPDMLLSHSGAVLVSSNVQPRLWRVGPARFEVEVYDIELASDVDKDIGFVDLAWGRSEATVYAASAPGGAPWRIDLATATAAASSPTSAGSPPPSPGPSCASTRTRPASG